MNSLIYWAKFGVCMAVAVAMLVFSGLFMRHVFIALSLDKGELVFSSLLLGLILFLVGGGLLLTTLGQLIKRATTRGRLDAR